LESQQEWDKYADENNSLHSVTLLRKRRIKCSFAVVEGTRRVAPHPNLIK